MPTIIQSKYGSLTSEKRALWTPYYHAVLNILGTTGIIIPLGDTNDENAGRTTVTTRGEIQAVFTYSEAISAFDSPPTFLGPAGIPVISFNGTDEEADSPDNAYWSRAGGAFSVGAWVNLTDATSSAILAKYTTAGDLREWVFWLDASDKLQLILYDENDATTPNATIDSEADSAITQGSWVFVVATYDGTANASGINLYQDGVVIASTDTDDANFSSLRDTTALVELGMANGTSFFDGQMAGGPLGKFMSQTALTADQVLRLYQLGRAALGV